MEHNALSFNKAERISNEIFNPFIKLTMVYIDVLIYSESVDQHFKHLNIFSTL